MIKTSTRPAKREGDRITRKLMKLKRDPVAAPYIGVPGSRSKYEPHIGQKERGRYALAKGD